MVGTPWEAPAPVKSAYRVSPMKAMSATPLTLGLPGPVDWLEGRLSMRVVRWPLASILEMREPVTLPV